MKRVAALSVVAAVVMLGGCERARPVASGGKLRVVASIFPLADVTRRIGGEFVEVDCLLRAGESPHDYEPRAEQAEAVAGARLLVMVGLGIDEWAARAAGVARSKDVVILKVAEDPAFKKLFASRLRPDTEGEEEAERHHAPDSAPAAGRREHERLVADPHVWLDPVFMQQFVREIAEALAAADPAHKDDYFKNRDDYLAKLKELDEEYRRTLAPHKGQGFVMFHAAFAYVAERYGLRQEALYTAEAEGFGGDRLEKVIRFVKDNKVKAIFAEPQFPKEQLEELARLTGTRVGQLDDQGNPYVKGYDSYLGMMTSNLAALAAGLKE